MALDPARVRVKVDPDPEDWELTGAPPEFVAGLDIADPEFEDWIRDQRAGFADRIEAAQKPAPPADGGSGSGVVGARSCRRMSSRRSRSCR